MSCIANARFAIASFWHLLADPWVANRQLYGLGRGVATERPTASSINGFHDVFLLCVGSNNNASTSTPQQCLFGLQALSQVATATSRLQPADKPPTASIFRARHVCLCGMPGGAHLGHWQTPARVRHGACPVPQHTASSALHLPPVRPPFLLALPATAEISLSTSHYFNTILPTRHRSLPGNLPSQRRRLHHRHDHHRQPCSSPTRALRPPGFSPNAPPSPSP